MERNTHGSISMGLARGHSGFSPKIALVLYEEAHTAGSPYLLFTV